MNVARTLHPRSWRACFAAAAFVLACGHMSAEEAERACTAKNGLYFVDRRSMDEEASDAGARAGVCLQRSDDAARRCRARRECAIACFCDDATDGQHAVGVCAAFPPMPGSGWQCTIDDEGIAHTHGIIVGAATGVTAPAPAPDRAPLR